MTTRNFTTDAKTPSGFGRRFFRRFQSASFRNAATQIGGQRLVGRAERDLRFRLDRASPVFQNITVIAFRAVRRTGNFFNAFSVFFNILAHTLRTFQTVVAKFAISGAIRRSGIKSLSVIFFKKHQSAATVQCRAVAISIAKCYLSVLFISRLIRTFSASRIVRRRIDAVVFITARRLRQFFIFRPCRRTRLHNNGHLAPIGLPVGRRHAMPSLSAGVPTMNAVPCVKRDCIRRN